MIVEKDLHRHLGQFKPAMVDYGQGFVQGDAAANVASADRGGRVCDPDAHRTEVSFRRADLEALADAAFDVESGGCRLDRREDRRSDGADAGVRHSD